MLSDPDELPRDVDMWAESLIGKGEEIVELFSSRFFFGCEADDPLNALAFTADINPGGAVLPATFSSDIGHWDVPDMRDVVPEAYELVEKGRMKEDQFRAFVFENPVRLWTGMNPAFFAGTSVEVEAARVVGPPTS